MSRKKDRPFWTAVLITLLVMLGIILMCGYMGCESTPQDSKQISEVNDKLTDTQKTATAIKEAVEGNQNILNTVTDNKKITLQQIHKEVTNLNQQISKGVGVNADTIDELKSEINNVHNSTLLMAIIIGSLIIFALIELLIIALVIKKLFSLKFQIQRVIASPDNPLKQEDFDRYRR